MKLVKHVVLLRIVPKLFDCLAKPILLQCVKDNSLRIIAKMHYFSCKNAKKIINIAKISPICFLKDSIDDQQNNTKELYWHLAHKQSDHIDLYGTDSRGVATLFD